MKKKIVVVGNGMAGARVVEEILKRGRDSFEIVMFGAEPYGNYNRILLSNVLNQTQNSEEIITHPLSWYRENNIALYTGVKVVHIDCGGKNVFVQSMPPGLPAYGTVSYQPRDTTLLKESYDFLILATGSRPFVPPIEGFGWPGTFLFRTIDDCRRIGQYAKNCRKAVVIGGGLLGLEAARGLMTHDLDVTIIEAAPQLMPAQLDQEAARMLKNIMEGMGLHVLVDTVTTEILRKDGKAASLVFKNGTLMATDMVVVSTGTRPITELAVHAALKVNRGVVCDDQLRTSDPNIFALGECVEHRGVVYGLVEPIWEQAKVAADVITGCGIDAEYAGSQTGTKLKVMGVELASLGEKEPGLAKDEVIVYRDPSRGIYKKMIVRDNRIHGAILLGDTTLANDLMRLYRRKVELPRNRTEVLFGSAAGTSLLEVKDLPETAQICNCNGVSKKEITDAILEHNCRSVAAVGAKTRAGSGCGSCRGAVAKLIETVLGDVSYDPREHDYVPGVPLEKSKLVAEIKARGLKSVSSVFKELAAGKEDPQSKPGLASLLKTIWPEGYEDERDARFINDRVHANIQNDGTFSVVPRIYGGVTSPEELMRIARTAAKYNVRMVKLTGGQRIDLLGISKEDLPEIWRDLGMPSGHAYAKAFRTCKSCVGRDFCRFGLGDSISLSREIERRFQGIECPHKVKMAAAGCPRNCSEAYVKDVGVVAIEGGRWEIYIGGAAGSSVRKGDLLCVVETHGEVLKIAGRFLQYYREHAKFLERTYSFVERIGIDLLKGILVEDSLGICAQLEERVQQAVDAYSDPWAEADTPAYPFQFEGSTLSGVFNGAGDKV